MTCKHDWQCKEEDGPIWATCSQCNDQMTWAGLFCEASEAYSDLKAERDALKKSLAQACDLLNKANLYVDVCDECKHVDHAVEWMHVNELDADIRAFVEAHQEVKCP